MLAGIDIPEDLPVANTIPGKDSWFTESFATTALQEANLLLEGWMSAPPRNGAWAS
jgi:hypothetical protein